MLNQESSQRSAKIYQFPTGGRAGVSQQTNGDTKASLATAARLNQALCSDSWYHQAAIDESRPVRDH